MAVDLQGNIIDEEGNKSGQTVNLDTGKVSGTITSDLFGGDQTPFDTGDPVSIGGTNASTSAIAGVDDILGGGTGAVESTVTADEDRLAAIISGLGEAGSVLTEDGIENAAFRAKTEEETGVTDITSDLEELDARLSGLKKESAAIPLQIQEEFAGRGATAGGVAPVEASRLRNNAIQSLSVAAQADFLQGRLTNAQAKADKIIELEFADEFAEIQALENQLKINARRLNKEETLRAERVQADLDERKRLLTEQANERQNIIGVAGSVAGKVDGATMDKIFNAGSFEEAIGLAAPFLTDSETQLTKLENGNTVLVNTQTGEVIKNLGGAKEVDTIASNLGFENATVGSPEYVLGTIQNSAQFGDTRLTDSRLEKIDQATLALGSVESLTTLLGLGDEGTGANAVDLSGPITGRKRTLISALGGDVTAAGINAAIQGLIPTVARGIFGEVGVLTDADINNYKKTIPNLNSTADQNTLITVIMLDVLSRSFESTLMNSARNQTNVSGFADQYINIRNRIEDEKLKLGVTPYNDLDDGEFLEVTEEANNFGDFNSNFNLFNQ